MLKIADVVTQNLTVDDGLASVPSLLNPRSSPTDRASRSITRRLGSSGSTRTGCACGSSSNSRVTFVTS